jgi:hypothetical protein
MQRDMDKVELSCMPGVLESGVSTTEVGLDELREVAQRTLGQQGLPAYFTYRVRVGVK